MINNSKIPIFDTHTHLIHCVDDGSKSWNITLCMLYQMQQQGVRCIIATPHSSAFAEHPDLIRSHYQSMAAAVKDFDPGMKVAIGCEVLCDRYSIQETLHRLKDGTYLTMAWTNYVLCEFPFDTNIENIHICCDALLNAGYVPILAHIERYNALAWNFGQIDNLRSKKLGNQRCLLQLNTSSLYPHESAEHWAKALAQAHKIDLLGSDCHDTGTHPPKYREAIKWLQHNCGEDYTRCIAWDLPRKLFTKL